MVHLLRLSGVTTQLCNPVTSAVITPRSARLPQVVAFHQQSRARFLARNLIASVAITLHMLCMGDTGGTRPTKNARGC